MDRLFRIDFYPQDWLIGTGTLTPEECGVYIQIISLIYARRGPIENDHEDISRKLKSCSPRLARSIIDRLIGKGKIFVIDGKLSQGRAEDELNNKRTHLEVSANGGRRKAQIERQLKENNDLTSTDDTIPVDTSSPSPSPSPKEGKKENLLKVLFEIPAWIPADDWKDFVEMRQKIRKPMTARAKKLAVGTLEKLKVEGHDPKAVLQQSIFNAYQGLFAPKGNSNENASRQPSYSERLKAAGDRATASFLAELEQSGTENEQGKVLSIAKPDDTIL